MCECEHGFMHVQYCNARSSWTPNACKRTCLRCFQVRADPPPTNSTVSAASKLVRIADHHQRTVLRHLQTAMCTLLFLTICRLPSEDSSPPHVWTRQKRHAAEFRLHQKLVYFRIDLRKRHWVEACINLWQYCTKKTTVDALHL